MTKMPFEIETGLFLCTFVVIKKILTFPYFSALVLELEVGSVSSHSAVTSTTTAPCRHLEIAETKPLQTCALLCTMCCNG